MPKVAVDNSPLQERAAFGYDGSDYRVVKVDTSGNLVAAVLAGSSIAVTQSDDTLLKATVALKADQNVQARGYGWIAAAWQKQPLPIGYSAGISKDTFNGALAAGTNSLLLPTVPAGEVWCFTNILFYYTGTVATVRLIVQMIDGVGNPYLFGQAPPVSAQLYDRQGQWFTPPGGYIQLVVQNATLNDVAEIGAIGFAFDIDQ